MNWYGGSLFYGTLYPVQKNNHKNIAYHQLHNGRYWLNSRGFFLLIDYGVPLFVDQNSIYANHLCITAKNESPYSTVNKTFNFKYKIGFSSNAKRTQMNVVNRYFRKSWGYPDENRIRNPSYTPTYVFNHAYTEDTYKNYTNTIAKSGLKIGALSFEVHYTTCFGSNKVDTKRFPNMKQLLTDLRNKYQGIKLFFKLHPFIETACLPNFQIATKNKYLMELINGTTTDNGVYNSHSRNSSELDFSNPDTSKWLKTELIRLKQETGVDGFEFAGYYNFSLYPNTHQDKSISLDLAAFNYYKLEDEFRHKLRFRDGLGAQNLNELTNPKTFFVHLPMSHDWPNIKMDIIQIIHGNIYGFKDFIRRNYLFNFHNIKKY